MSPVRRARLDRRRKLVTAAARDIALVPRQHRRRAEFHGRGDLRPDHQPPHAGTRRAGGDGPPADAGRAIRVPGPSKHFDFTSPRFRAWLVTEDLKRKSAERDLDFAHRAMQAMVKTYTYRFELKSDRSASAVCKAGWSDCGGLATVYVSILRSNGIPARCLSGRNVKPDSTHVRLDFYAEGVGWVPGDPALAIGSTPPTPALAASRPTW